MRTDLPLPPWAFSHALGRLAAAALLCLACGRVGATPSITGGSNSSTTVTFPSASPSTGAVAATENPISVSIQFSGSSSWTLTLIGNGDLTSGANTIPISDITWTATGASFVGGTLSKTSQVTAGSGSTGGASPYTASGTLSFRLANRWTYATGSYTQTITVTATAL